MRPLPQLIFALALASYVQAAEPYPLWDGHESVADYARRTNLPSTKTLDLCNGVKLELVLIPAGKFIMGTPEPAPVDEEGFRKKILAGQALLAVSAAALLGILIVVAIREIRRRHRPQLSLRLLLVVTALSGSAVLSGVHWSQSAKARDAARVALTAALARFQAAGDNEKPAHPVTLTQPFYMEKFPVTQEQYHQMIGLNPSTSATGKNNPVETVSYSEAEAFCNKLSEHTNVAVRLPTEAEWEYSCRAGSTTACYSGDLEKDLAQVAWYYANSKSTTHSVGGKIPNAFGLYDTLGNVWQMCQWNGVYSANAATDPRCDNAWCAWRGGAYYYYPGLCRAALRQQGDFDGRAPHVGFRVLMTVVSAPKREISRR